MDLSTPISKCGFSTRTLNILKDHACKTLEDVSAYSDSDLLKMRGFGQACLKEVKDKLSMARSTDLAVPLGMVVASTVIPTGAVPTNTVNTATEYPIQTESTNSQEQCDSCCHSRANCQPGTIECHRGSPQVHFRQLGNGEIQHVGYWPTVPADKSCGEFKEKDEATKI